MLWISQSNPYRNVESTMHIVITSDARKRLRNGDSHEKWMVHVRDRFIEWEMKWIHILRKGEIQGEVYAELYLGRDDPVRRDLRRLHRTDECVDERSTGQCRGSSQSLYYHGRGHGIVDGTDGDRAGVRDDYEDDKRDPAFSAVYVSKAPGESSGGRIYCYESDRQCSGTGLGLHTGRVESNGTVGGTGKGARGTWKLTNISKERQQTGFGKS